MSCCATITGADQSPRQAVEEARLAASGRDLGEGLAQLTFSVPDMHCGACLTTIERGLGRLDQVARVRANLSTRTVAVAWRPEVGPAGEITATLEGLGYRPLLAEDADTVDDALAARGRALLMSLAVAGFAAANVMLLSVSVWSGADAATAQLFHLISALIAVPAVAYAGRPFFGSALGALSAGRLNMDVPISLAVLLALGMSLWESLTGGAEAYFDAAVTLLFFLLIGRYLDHLMRERARGAVRQLAGLAPRGAIEVGADGATGWVALAEINLGMRLRVPAGERLAVDGTVVEGRADTDRSLVTGESAPVVAGPGDRLEAGVLVLNGALDIRAETTAETSFLAEIARMIEAAEAGRGAYVRIAERMARIYAPAVHLLALAAFVGWMALGAGWHTSLMTAIAVLIVTCPCALGLAVPVVHVVAAGRLFAEGIMMRDGAALERLAEADVAVFDKTGTLTRGAPEVVEVSRDPGPAIPSIRALAARSGHPAARAVLDRLGPGPEIVPDTLTEVPGAGIVADVDGRTLRLGRPAWLGVEADGSAVAFSDGGEPVVFRLRDALRPEAAEAVAALRDEGLVIEIASGDAPEAVARIAGRLSVAVARAELRPEDKIALVEQHRSVGHKVLMVGDGINDAPALAAGHVSMAPGQASEIGRSAADFVFTRDQLTAVPFARRIAVKAGRLVRQNFGLALAYNAVAVPLAMAGHVTPLVAAIAMSASSIVVVLNSLRLAVRRPLGVGRIRTRIAREATA